MSDVVPVSVSGRLTSPGAFRLFLAMLVFVSHFSSLSLGAYAVYVFFVLSGFWLQRMWRERYADTRSPYLTYMTSRLWRLAPVMILVTGPAIASSLAFGATDAATLVDERYHLAFSSIFLVGYAWLTFPPIGPAWSLDIEMQFYILAPLLSVAQRSRVLQMGLIGVAAILSLLSSLSEMAPILPRYAVFFVLGMIAAQVDWRPSRRTSMTSLAILAIIVAGILLSPLRGLLSGGAHPGPLFQYHLPCNVLLAFITIPFAIYTTGRRSDPTDRMMADLSYIVYLLHWIAVQWFVTVQGSFLHRLPYAVASFLIVPPLAWLIWRYYDKPINHARSRWVAARTHARVARVEAEVSAP